jgi:hypothetical protein
MGTPPSSDREERREGAVYRHAARAVGVCLKPGPGRSCTDVVDLPIGAGCNPATSFRRETEQRGAAGHRSRPALASFHIAPARAPGGWSTEAQGSPTLTPPRRSSSDRSKREASAVTRSVPQQLTAARDVLRLPVADPSGESEQTSARVGFASIASSACTLRCSSPRCSPRPPSSRVPRRRDLGLTRRAAPAASAIPPRQGRLHLLRGLWWVINRMVDGGTVSNDSDVLFPPVVFGVGH